MNQTELDEVLSELHKKRDKILYLIWAIIFVHSEGVPKYKRKGALAAVNAYLEERDP